MNIMEIQNLKEKMNHSKEHLIYLVCTIMEFVVVYFSPTYPLIAGITLFILADLVTGIKASKKRGEEYSSKKLRSTVDKFISYGICIIVAFMIEKLFLKDIPCMKLIGGLVAYIEVKSINENVETITGTNVFDSLLSKLKQ